MSICSLERGLRNRLWVIDIPLYLQHGIRRLVIKWVQNSGVEWTIKRLKSLKVDLYRRRAGLPSLTWVRKNRDGDIAGEIGGLFRWSSKSRRNFRKAVQTLMCYTVFVYSKPTPSQVKKFTSALSAPPPVISPDFDYLYQAVKKSFGSLTVDRSSDVSLLTYQGSSSIRKPSRNLRSVPQNQDVITDIEILLESGYGMDLIARYRSLFAPVMDGLETHPHVPSDGYSGFGPEMIQGGRIAFLQEPGGKLRSIASPFLAYQLALRHFGKTVYGFIRHLPWDCTHDQSRPHSVLQDHLLQGKTVHSVDLSSATDYFPLEVQVKLMRSLFGNIPDISLFNEISRSTWKSPIGDVRWNRGQPLGLFPSFAVFAASHGLLLWFLNNCQWKKEFFVLGDDVVILDDDLHRRYVEILHEWGCPYSPEKSLSSNQICEFAGKVITSEMVLPQFKWREMSNDNFVDIVRHLGHRSRILLTKKQKLVFDKIKHLTSPFGLNFSYPGSSLVEMECATARFSSDRRILDSLVDQRETVNRNIYSHDSNSGNLFRPTTVNTEVVMEKTSTLDERVRSVLSNILPWFSKQEPRLYASVPDGVGDNSLPLVTLLPSRMTTLDRYLRLLSIDNEPSVT